ncbi:hypothetical protein BDK51DRAFT_28985 [Blyttiomyces helicus]|uniref:Uncharacterized protein n=1 Tax=Blyttiomyces helicus TaxID=388810 RepID=A0A4P9WMU2_9FUNG|nr:hypothetical protein BDK51DRAFT_28985 [Blyttiomyces helicus]|eukprot:RKO93353.1 hypothetical protein BDK51DRAFT_28985 [Blyttiomyces helicus]
MLKNVQGSRRPGSMNRGELQEALKGDTQKSDGGVERRQDPTAHEPSEAESGETVEGEEVQEVMVVQKKGKESGMEVEEIKEDGKMVGKMEGGGGAGGGGKGGEPSNLNSGQKPTGLAVLPIAWSGRCSSSGAQGDSARGCLSIPATPGKATSQQDPLEDRIRCTPILKKSPQPLKLCEPKDGSALDLGNIKDVCRDHAENRSGLLAVVIGMCFGWRRQWQ